jgi:hypothetical protein
MLQTSCITTIDVGIEDDNPSEKEDARMSKPLADELKTYEENFESLLGAHEGKFVLVYGNRVLGTFDSPLDAITWGYRELGNVPFLVKQVMKVEAPLSFVSNLLAV